MFLFCRNTIIYKSAQALTIKKINLWSVLPSFEFEKKLISNTCKRLNSPIKPHVKFTLI